jgi:hypothetical protein
LIREEYYRRYEDPAMSFKQNFFEADLLFKHAIKARQTG